MTVYGRRVWIAVVGAAIAVGGMPSLVFAEAEKAYGLGSVATG